LRKYIFGMRIPLPFPVAAALAAAAASLSAQTPSAWRYTEELRIGSEADDVTGFSEIRGLLVNRKGNIWILEASLQEIRVFDSAGKHLRTVGRKGQGPGEFTGADGLVEAPDGRIWVHDPRGARLTIFDQEGSFLRHQILPPNGRSYLWSGGIDAEARVWDEMYVPDPDHPTRVRFRRAAPDFTRSDTVTIPSCNRPGEEPRARFFQFPSGTMMVPFYPAAVTAIDLRRGAVWCAPKGDEYRVYQVGIQRPDTLARITGRADRVPVSGAERDTAVAKVKAFMKRAGETSFDWSRIPKYKPLLVAAFVDESGRLWLRRSAAGIVAAFDIYSPEGLLVGTLTVPHPVTTWHRPVVRGDRAYFVAQEEGEIPYVIRARIGPAH